MGPEDAVRGCEMLRPKMVIPMHYDTFDLISKIPRSLPKAGALRIDCRILKPGNL